MHRPGHELVINAAGSGCAPASGKTGTVLLRKMCKGSSWSLSAPAWTFPIFQACGWRRSSGPCRKAPGSGY